MNSRRR